MDNKSYNISEDVISSIVMLHNSKLLSSSINRIQQTTFETSANKGLKNVWGSILNQAFKFERPAMDEKIISQSLAFLGSSNIISDWMNELALKALPYLKETDRNHIIVILLDQIPKSPKNASLILVELFIAKPNREWRQDAIRDGIKFLFENGFSDEAQQICIVQAEGGNYFLNEIYYKYK